MNKFEQGSLEKGTEDNPNHILERVDSFTVPKIKRILEEVQTVEHPALDSKLEKLIEETEDKFRVRVLREDLLRKALEDISVENGMLPEKLRDAYMSILIDRVLEKTGDDGDVHSEIESELERLREGSVYIDEDDVRSKASEAYYKKQETEIFDEENSEDDGGR
jgi:hypothetical protein